MKLSLDIQLKKDNFQLNIQQDIQWDDPSVHVIFGPSGCGKSHVLRAICGLEAVTGHLQFYHHTWLDSHNKINVPTHKRNVAMVFQDSQLFTHLNVQQNLEFSFDRSDCTPDEFDLCIQQLNIQHLLKHAIQDLSGGEKQRVAIARSLLSKPDLLLMDEPLASLDWKSKAEILPFIQTISQTWQLPILYVSHNIDEVMQLADQVILLDKQNGISKIDKVSKLTELLSDIDNPFNQHPDAGCILQGFIKYEGYQNDGLIKVQLAEQFLYLTHTHQMGPAQQNVRLNIHASDVSISLSHAMDSSILNILNGKILDIKPEASGHCLIQLEVDQQILLSRISAYSAKRLNLKMGMNVFAQIKAVALSK